jgi:hypothetical protein
VRLMPPDGETTSRRAAERLAAAEKRADRRHPTSRDAPSVSARPSVLREVRAMDAQEIKIEEALKLYYRFAEEFNSLLPGGVPYEVLLNLRVSALLVLQGYRRKDNWNDGRPIIPIPPEMALDLAEDIDSVLGGHIPRWMLHMQKRGAPKHYPAMERDIETAVLYHALSERGIIEDRTPTKTVADKFRVSRRTVQQWIEQIHQSIFRTRFPDCVGDAALAIRVTAEFPTAADRYAAHRQPPSADSRWS